MIFRILLLLIAFMPMATQAEEGIWSTITSFFKKPAPLIPPMIRVLIVNDKPGVVLEVKGKYKIYDPFLRGHISTRFIGKRKFIQAVQDGLKWGEEFPGLHQIKIVPDHPNTTTLVDGIEYRGSIYVYDIGGAISIVNEVYVEDYLNSILALKYPTPMPTETEAAIAITARTNAYYQVEHPRNKFWDVDGNQVDYQGYAVTLRSSGINEAIQATRYMVMSRQSEETGKPGPFLGQWNEQEGSSQGALARISILQAMEMADNGDNAAKILARAFPGSTIHLIRYDSEARETALKD